jgi:plasmid stabilization system protein ParE
MSAYRFSRSANQDVAETANYLFALNPVAADRFLARLEQTCELLSAHPGLGRARPEFGEEVRSFRQLSYFLQTQRLRN